MARVATQHAMPLYAIVTDLERLVVIKCRSRGVEDAIPLIFQRYAEVQGKDRVRDVLNTFLRANPGDLGVFPDCMIFPFSEVSVTTSKTLGEGAHGRVWMVVENPSWVLKEFHGGDAQAEAHALKTIGPAAAIPAIIASSKDHLLLMPRGEKLSDAVSVKGRWPLLLGVAISVVGALQTAHSRDLVHRDVRASNIVVVMEGENPSMPYLIDWASACVAGKRLPYSGTTYFASVAVLEQMMAQKWEVTVKPKDDLESLVFTIAAELSAELETKLFLMQKNDVAGIASLWVTMISEWPALNVLVTLARQVNYEALLSPEPWEALSFSRR